MEFEFELSSELELTTEELNLIISDYFDVDGDKIVGLSVFDYCYQIIKKYLRENNGNHQNLLFASYVTASDISSNIFFINFANEMANDLEMRNFILAARCKSIEKIITDALTETCKYVDRGKIRELVRSD